MDIISILYVDSQLISRARLTVSCVGSEEGEPLSQTGG